MALKTATVNRSQNATDSKQKVAFQKAVKELQDCSDLILKGEEAKKRAVKIVEDYVANVPRGQKDKERVRLCQKAGIHRSTFFRWQADVEIGPVLNLAEKHDRTIDTPLRKAILEARDENPGASAEEIYQKACAIADAPKAESVETDPKQALTDAVFAYLRKTDNDAEGLLQVIKDQAIPTEKICAALKGLCR